MTPEQMEQRIAELEERIAQFEAKTGFMSADTMKANAEAWIERNPKAWAFVKNDARAAVRDKTRFSIKKTLENLRSLPGFVWQGDDFKISNSYSSVFARILLKEVPGLDEVMTVRRSKVDRLFR